MATARRRMRRVRPYLFFYVLFASVLIPIHASLLDMPYFWDELGQFAPASLDIYEFGSLIPRTVVPNAHPPGVMLYVAGVWKVFGVSIEAARLAILAVAAAGALAAFLLAIQLARGARGAPAFIAAALLLASPWFYSQSMLVQLDMPAMAFSAAALLWFLQDRMRLSAAACVALVLVKETGAIVPALFCTWLFWERRRREGALFLAPFLALAVWFAYLASATGHPFGSGEFTQYNLVYSLHPARMTLAFIRRLYMLLIGGFHWIGAAAVAYALLRTRLFASRAWRLAGAFVAVHVLAFTVTGGAVLERYLMPVMPVVYAAAACAFTTLQGRWRTTAPAAAIVGAVCANFIAPPYPYPLENNQAFKHFVELQRTAAGFLEAAYPETTVATAWPMSAALQRPELGYVSRRFRVRQLKAIGRETKIAPGETLVAFSFDRERRWRLPFAGAYRAVARSVYGAREPLPPLGLSHRLRLVAHWSRGGHWIEIYRPGGAGH
jgi:4-amino-4-deoxy-L-arabinose transferase-like glycosyltransferase